MTENSGEDDFTIGAVNEGLMEAFAENKQRIKHLSEDGIEFRGRDRDFTLELVNALERAVELLEQYMEKPAQSAAMRLWVILGKTDDEALAEINEGDFLILICKCGLSKNDHGGLGSPAQERGCTGFRVR
jgi:hypothetical protein